MKKRVKQVKNKVISAAALILALVLLCSCGQEIDEDAVIENNATSKVTADGNVFEISGGTITMNGSVIAENVDANEEKLVVLGNKIYFNTDEGTKYLSLKNGKIKKFGNGQIVYAKGIWLYYNNIDLYMVSVTDGKQSLLHQRTEDQPMLQFKEDTGEKIIFTDGEKDYYIKNDGTALTEM